MAESRQKMPPWVRRARRIRWAKRASMVVSLIFLAGMMSGGWSRFTGGSAKPDPGHGYISVTATPTALVAIDDVARGITPLIRYKLPVGQHQVVLTSPETGVVVGTRQIKLTAGAHEQVEQVARGEFGATEP